MPDLQLNWPTGAARFNQSDSPILIGRSASAQVPLTDGSVSREHLRLVWTEAEGWRAEDSSTHGTYDADGQRQPPSWPINRRQELRLGGTEGVAVTIAPSEPAGERRRSAAGAERTVVAGRAAPTAVPQGDTDLPPSSTGVPQRTRRSMNRIVVAPPDLDAAAEGAGASALPTGAQPTVGLAPNALGNVALRLTVDGQDHTFLPGADITVGRDPSSKIRLDERHTLVSRRHLRIRHRDDAWWIEDESSKGTWVDGRRIRGPYRAEGAFLVNLGHADAGTPMRLITGGTHRSPLTLGRPLVVALGLAIVVPLIALVAVLLRSGEEELDLESAKRSTVMLFGLDGGQGSGFFVDEDLLLTNQHVAALSPQLLVAVSREADKPAEIEYATELVANHPFLDIALLRISNPASVGDNGVEIGSGVVGDIDLPTVAIGDSDELSIGDPVFSAGFPGSLSFTISDNQGALRLPPVVVASGQLSSVTLWPGCSNPTMATFIPAESPPGVGCSPDGDVDRGVLLSDFSSSEGASGSPVYNEKNQVVAVVYAGSREESTASLDIASSAWSDWLAATILDTN